MCSEFKLLAALNPQNIGNSVLGWAPTYTCQPVKTCGGACVCQQCVCKKQVSAAAVTGVSEWIYTVPV
jgi:hypothetical protein